MTPAHGLEPEGLEGLVGVVGVVAVGIDAVDVARMRSALDATPSLIDRAFTESERAYALRQRDSAQRFAARWAMKEAVVKCLGGGVPGIDLRCIDVDRGEGGEPSVRLSGRAAELAAQRGIVRWLVSMTHTDTTAMAIAVGLSA